MARVREYYCAHLLRESLFGKLATRFANESVLNRLRPLTYQPLRRLFDLRNGLSRGLSSAENLIHVFENSA
jgi:hypothetical protein